MAPEKPPHVQVSFGHCERSLHSLPPPELLVDDDVDDDEDPPLEDDPPPDDDDDDEDDFPSSELHAERTTTIAVADTRWAKRMATTLPQPQRLSRNPRPSKMAGIAFSIRATRVADCLAAPK